VGKVHPVAKGLSRDLVGFNAIKFRVMMKKVIYLIVVVLAGLACSFNGHVTKDSKQISDNKYVLIVDSVSNTNAVKSHKAGYNFLHVYFESGFNNDEVVLCLNNANCLEANITTNQTSGLAKVCRLTQGDKSNWLELSIDRQMFGLKIDKRYSYVHLSKNKEKIFLVCTNQKYTYY
jgi:hypothetical protein